MAKILMYGIDWKDTAIFSSIADEMNIEIDTIDDSCVEETLEDLFKKENKKNESCKIFNEQYLFFKDVELENLKTYLEKVEEILGEFDGIKVGLTETNKSWKLKDVMKETSHENQIFKKTLLLRQILQSCESFDITTLNKEDQENFKACLLEAYLMLQGMDVNETRLDELMHELMHFLREGTKVLH